MKLISIIICTYNRELLLRNCLDELIKQMPDFSETTEVIVVDNNCVDNTAEMVRQLQSLHPWLQYVKESKQGLSNARNCGANEAIGKYLCYLDDDGKPGENYLTSIYRMLENESPDIAGGPIYPYYTTTKPRWFHDEFEIRKHSPVTGYSLKCNVSGGNFIILKDLLFALGLFSPNLGMVGNKTRLGEEAELLLRYRKSREKALQKVYYDLDCFIYHHVPQAKMKWSYFIKRGFFSGRATVVVKNESWNSLRYILKRFFSNCLYELPLSLVGKANGDKKSVWIVMMIALDIGKISMLSQRYLSRLITQKQKA